METIFTYKVYDKDGAYIKNLPVALITNEPIIVEQINTINQPIDIQIKSTFEDAGATTITDPLVDHLGDPIIDHLGDPMYASFEYSFSTLPIEPGYTIDVWQYDQYDVNGVRIFTGEVESWSYDEGNKGFTVRVTPWADCLRNYLVQTPPNTAIAEQINSDSTLQLYSYFPTPSSSQIYEVAQTFQSVTDVDLTSVKLTVELGTKIIDPIPPEALPLQIGTLSVSIFTGTPGGTVENIGTASAYVTSEGKQEITITHSNPKRITAGDTFFIRARFYSLFYSDILIDYNSAGGYASGQRYTYTSGGGWVSATGDLKFSIYTSGGGIGQSFFSYDPGNIVRYGMSTLQSLGGNLSGDSTSIELTGTKVSYEFNFNHFLDLLEKARQLAPPNWYWRIDQSENKLYFKRKGQAADHTLVVGKHIAALKVSRTIRDMVNDAYLNGGDAGTGTNIVVRNTSQASYNTYRPKLKLISDLRIEDTDTAAIYAKSEADESSQPKFLIETNVLAATYDIKTIKIGDVIQFRNTNDYIKSIKLHVTELSRSKTAVRIKLDTALPSTSHRIEDIKRNLNTVMTINNPSVL